MQGSVHGLSCVVGFTVPLGQLGLTRSRSGVCVCSRGGMAGCLAGPWWGYVHVQLCAANDWVLVGGRTMFSLCCIFALGSWERHPLGRGQECVESGPRVGRERVRSGAILGQSLFMRATSCGSGEAQERSASGSIVDHAWTQSRPSIDCCSAIDVPKQRVRSGPMAGQEWATSGPRARPPLGHPADMGHCHHLRYRHHS